MTKKEFPLHFSIDYKESYNRLTTFFRLITLIPIAIVYSALVSSTKLILCPLVLMILFKQKYPKWWFDFNLELSRFSARVFSYAFFLVDETPSTDNEQSIHLDFEYPNANTDLHRVLPLIKWFLAVPHYIALALLSLFSLLLTTLAWFSILISGQYPKKIFDYNVGLYRWGLRVQAYAFLLTTDIYPPFSLK
jgi:hypothetical protein